MIDTTSVEKKFHASTQCIASAITAFGAAFSTSRAAATSEATSAAKLKVVYHLNDLDKVNFVLGNIQYHFDGIGGPDHITIALVVHSQALRVFHSSSANPDISRRVSQSPTAASNLPPAATP